jgi:hypothetical protein
VRRRVTLLLVLIAVGFLLVQAGGSGTAATSDGGLKTECASGVLVHEPPGVTADEAGIPVVIDSQLSKDLYGDSVDVTDGIDADEAEVVEAKADSIKFCLVEDDGKGEHYETVIIE